MEEIKNLKPAMKCEANYLLKDDQNGEIAKGKCDLSIDKEKLTILPQSGEPLLIPYRDFVTISKGNYKIEILLVSKETIVLSNLGYKFEDFSRNLANFNNEVILKDLLMSETNLVSGLMADLKYTGDNQIEQDKGQCELRIYETGLLIITGAGDFVRIPYCDISKNQVNDYKLIVSTDYQETYVFSQMGKELEKSARLINESMNKLSKKIQISLEEIFTYRDSSVIRKIAQLMKDGRAARRLDIEAINPELWSELEQRLDLLGIKEQYEYLKSLAQSDRMCIGTKRGLMGDLTGEYTWFLAPIYDTDITQPGNAIAMEATSDDDSGKATYFFRMTDWSTYLNCRNLTELQAEADKAIRKLNHHLVAINFRREPIYQTEEQLQSPKSIIYRRAVSKIPALRELRNCFIGRVMHYSPEQWKAAVIQTLESNKSK